MKQLTKNSFPKYQSAHAAQYQKNKQSNQKLAQDISPKKTYTWLINT